MKYTAEEVIEFVKEEDVKFIRLAFCNEKGIQKNLSIMPTELARAFKSGIPINDGILHPDPSTLAMYPWRPDHGKVVRMYCSITDETGEPLDSDHRKKLIDSTVNFTISEIIIQADFYLFIIGENGNRTLTPYDEAGYLDIAPLDKCENIRRSICLTLESMGITPMYSCHSYGPGQNSITFKSTGILESADNLATFFTVVRTMAASSGLYADFHDNPFESEEFPTSKLTLRYEKDGEKKSVIFSPNVNPYTAHEKLIVD